MVHTKISCPQLCMGTSCMLQSIVQSIFIFTILCLFCVITITVHCSGNTFICFLSIYHNWSPFSHRIVKVSHNGIFPFSQFCYGLDLYLVFFHVFPFVLQSSTRCKMINHLVAELVLAPSSVLAVRLSAWLVQSFYSINLLCWCFQVSQSLFPHLPISIS